MSFDPGSMLSRLRRMSWEEVRVRLEQEAWKRIDLASYRLGFAARDQSQDSEGGISGRFFFSAAELPDRVRCLAASLPDEVKATVREADEICRHRFSLLGYQGLDFGPEIDWHRDAVSGKRTPLGPWFKIHFLRYEDAGDHKVVWELNRHQHLVTLAKAWRLTGQRDYLDEILRQWDSWQKANPYPLGINWASSLEVAFRSLSWLWVLALLAESPLVAADFPSRVTRGLALNARHIERYLSSYFSPNTHLLGEAVALFFTGVLCPQLSGAARWKDKGWQILLQEAQRQVRGDGLYFEQSLYYHVYALDFFLHARILAACNEIAIPPAFHQTIWKMLEVLRGLAQVGPAEGFGDDDGGRVFNPRRNRTESLTDPLALGALLYEDVPQAALTDEAIWLFGEKAVTKLSQPRTVGQIESRSFPDGGLYVMADAATHRQLTIDAGPQGTGRCGHGHADALSILLTGGGRRWLVDSGTCRYISNSEERSQFRGTGAHNTLRVDRLDQSVPEGPFAWSAIPSTTTKRWVVGDSFNFFQGSHDGYMRLSGPVTHRRAVFLLKGRFWLIHDLAEGTGRHELEIFWHFAPDLQLHQEKNAFVAEPMGAATGEIFHNLVLRTCPTDLWSASFDTAPISPAYGTVSSAPVVRLHASAELPADAAVLLLPRSEDSALGELSTIRAQAQGVHTYRYQSVRDDHYFFFAGSERPWECGPWSSDAAFLYCGLQGECLVHLILVAGSFCRLHGKEVVTLDGKVDRMEWLFRGGEVAISSSNNAAIRFALARELLCSDPVI